jgi:membrane-bound lytic murein transglycosylase B
MRGSYAGALGIPQFMPSSYRKYAVVNSHEAGSNLLNHPGDAILSIANYLNHMGWQAGKPVAETLTARKVPAYLVSTSAQPQYSIKKLRALGISLPGSKESREKAAIIQLAGNPGSANYWLTFANFHSIMRYNPRINYAMAVYQLSEAIKNGYESRRTNRTSIHFASRGKTR